MRFQAEVEELLVITDNTVMSSYYLSVVVYPTGPIWTEINLFLFNVEEFVFSNYEQFKI